MTLREKNISTITKAVSIQVAPVKKEQDSRNAIANQLKFIILLAAGLGVNRTYIYNYRRLQKWFFHIYCFTMNFITVYALIMTDGGTASYKVLRDTGCAEYVLLVLIATFSQKSNFRSIFEDLSSFDSALKIKDDLDVTFPVAREMLWTIASIFYSSIEFIYLVLYYYDNTMSEIISTLLSYIVLMTHDMEYVLYCSLLRTILMRIRVLKAHVAAVLSDGKENKTKLDKVEALSKKAKLDINSLHRNYELLHKCAEQLNSIMSLPMMIMLLTSGLSSIMLLKSLFKVLQETSEDKLFVQTSIVYSIIRCIRYTTLVVVPCYYSSITSSQVSQIRVTLHDATNSNKIDKLERRRIKAFFQLTRDSEFAYALWGVIRLNMSLPLSYLSLCTTYLVIIIQFSKFID